MRIGVIGASGFIGKAFCQLALSKGHKVVGYSRRSRKSAEIEWRVFDNAPDLSNLDVIVNYAGESVAQRWSEAKKKEFYNSRVGVTEAIVNQLQTMPVDSRPTTLINASAVGYYGDCGNKKLTEESPVGTGYLADLCKQWEAAALEAESLGVRVVIGRIGIVLGDGGEAWEKMKTAFSFGIGGNLGSGQQWMPWVHVDDIAGATLHSVETTELSGAVNFVSPDPQKNADFTKALGKALSRPTLIPAPAFALRLAFGEFGKHLLDSYRVYPEVLESTGYEFKYVKLNNCLNNMLC